MPDLKASSRLGAHTNLLHGWIYFAPDAVEAYRSLGLDDDHSYFASRAAPMGEVSAAVVTATFFNFSPERIAGAIPAAWAVAAPAEVQAARMQAAGDMLHRVATDALSPADLLEANAVAEAICAGVGYEGRPLGGANRAVDLPDDPLPALWQRITTIREWRGDAHVAVLVASSVDAVEALVLHAGTGVVGEGALRTSRGWSDADWDAGIERLVARGLAHDDGSLTDDGIAFRAEIERRTDEISEPLVAAVGADAVHRLIDGLRPLREAILASGVLAPRR